MIVLLPTIKHTGSHFVLKKLLGAFERVPLKHAAFLEEEEQGDIVIFDHLYPHKMPLWEPLLEKYPALVPLRNKQAVIDSWNRRREDLEDFYDQWGLLRGLLKYNVHFLNIDHKELRDHQINSINRDLGINLDPGEWEIVRK